MISVEAVQFYEIHVFPSLHLQAFYEYVALHSSTELTMEARKWKRSNTKSQPSVKPKYLMQSSLPPDGVVVLAWHTQVFPTEWGPLCWDDTKNAPTKEALRFNLSGLP